MSLNINNDDQIAKLTKSLTKELKKKKNWDKLKSIIEELIKTFEGYDKEIDPGLVNVIIKALEYERDSEFSNPAGIRSKAAELLGSIHAETAVGHLCEALNDSTFVGMEAARALGKIKSPKAVESLCNLLRNNTLDNALTRKETAVALGEIGDKAAQETLYYAIVHDSEDYVQKAAALSLASLGDPRAMEPLMRFIEDISCDQIAHCNFGINIIKAITFINQTGYMRADFLNNLLFKMWKACTGNLGMKYQDQKFEMIIASSISSSLYANGIRERARGLYAALEGTNDPAVQDVLKTYQKLAE